ASEAPASITVITRRQIQERGYVNLSDLLEDLPGIDVNRKSAETFFNLAAIRGNVGNNKFIIMQNGIRIGSPTGENIPVADNFPLFHAEQVEVIFGPASALYGADAFTGVINIITQDAKRIDGAEVSAAVGTDDYYYGYLNFGKPLTGKIDLAVGGHWNSSQNPDLSKSYPQYFGKTDALNTDGTVFRSAQEREPFTAPTGSYSAYANLDYNKKLFFGMTESFLSHPSTTGNQPRNTIYAKDAVWETRIDSYHGKFKADFNPDLSGESLVQYSVYELQPGSGFTNSFANFRSFKYAKGTKLKLEQQMNYRMDEDHGLIGGFTFENFDHIPKTADLPSQYDTGRDANDQGFFYLGTDNTLPLKIFDINYQNYGGYLQAQSKWNDWFSSTIGLRLDYDTRFGESVNPRAGLVFKPLKDTVLKLLYGEAFLAPTSRISHEHFGSFTGVKDDQGRYISDFFHLPNPNLMPEKTRTYEADLIHNITPDFIVSGNFFYTEVQDTIANVFKDEPSTFIDGGIIRGFEIADNIGEAEIYGADLKADYQTYFWRTNVKFWGGYSWVEGRIKEPGGVTGPLPLTARNKIKTGVTLNYAEKYIFTPRIIWIDRTSNFRSFTAEKVRPYALVNLYAEAKNFYKGFSAFVNVRNLLDTDYFNATTGGQTFLASPQDPRTVFIGLKYKF
ncbi:MAG: TonB-dependent receptor, partial [Nitrospinae bacterium]|nr:TonB-dependent receptor [Nitrospinota bacterium]